MEFTSHVFSVTLLYLAAVLADLCARDGDNAAPEHFIIHLVDALTCPPGSYL